MIGFYQHKHPLCQSRSQKELGNHPNWGHQELLNQVVKEYDNLKDHLSGKTPNWESDRIARIDYIILITSTAELLYFPSIPTKVTLNEYIEIAKEFSSPGSGKFVNGVIDNIVKDLTSKGLIVKKGRGLIS